MACRDMTGMCMGVAKPTPVPASPEPPQDAPAAPGTANDPAAEPDAPTGLPEGSTEESGQ